jgi:hypothetical protein
VGDGDAGCTFSTLQHCQCCPWDVGLTPVFIAVFQSASAFCLLSACCTMCGRKSVLSQDCVLSIVCYPGISRDIPGYMVLGYPRIWWAITV